MLKRLIFTFFTIDYRGQPVKHDQTMNYLTENSILYRHQSEFCKNHSTDTSLAYLTDKILTGFDSGLLTGMILIDLQKAFDTINHNILLRKMSTLRFLSLPLRRLLCNSLIQPHFYYAERNRENDNKLRLPKLFGTKHRLNKINSLK